MPDPSLLQGAALVSILIAIAGVVVGVLVLYAVIYSAVKRALRAHAVWLAEDGPEAVQRRAMQRAVR